MRKCLIFNFKPLLKFFERYYIVKKQDFQPYCFLKTPFFLVLSIKAPFKRGFNAYLDGIVSFFGTFFKIFKNNRIYSRRLEKTSLFFCFFVVFIYGFLDKK